MHNLILCEVLSLLPNQKLVIYESRNKDLFTCESIPWIKSQIYVILYQFYAPEDRAEFLIPTFYYYIKEYYYIKKELAHSEYVDCATSRRPNWNSTLLCC